MNASLLLHIYKQYTELYSFNILFTYSSIYLHCFMNAGEVGICGVFVRLLSCNAWYSVELINVITD